MAGTNKAHWPSQSHNNIHRKEEAIAWGRGQEVRFDAADAGVHLPVKQTLAELLGRNVLVDHLK